MTIFDEIPKNGQIWAAIESTGLISIDICHFQIIIWNLKCYLLFIKCRLLLKSRISTKKVEFIAMPRNTLAEKSVRTQSMADNN
jgi:hypothetical protein